MILFKRNLSVLMLCLLIVNGKSDVLKNVENDLNDNNLATEGNSDSNAYRPGRSSELNSSIPELHPCDIKVGNNQVTWHEAQINCHLRHMVLMIFENEEDSVFFNKFELLKNPPFNSNTRYWSAARFNSTDYKKLLWQPSEKIFVNNSIGFTWGLEEPKDDIGNGTEICVDIRFPGDSLPVWFASDCDAKKPYICVHDIEQRKTDDCKYWLQSCDLVAGQQEATWDEAIIACHTKRMKLMIIEIERNNRFLNNVEVLKKAPFTSATRFWSAARFNSTDYKELLWEPWQREIPVHLNNNSKSIIKVWGPGEPKDDDGNGEEICVDIQFPGNSPPVWFASNCDAKKPYFCLNDGDPNRICTTEGPDNPDPLWNDTNPKPMPTIRPWPNSSVPVLQPCNIDVSQNEATWDEAQINCRLQNMILMVIERQEDNTFLNKYSVLKEAPFTSATRFWSAARFKSADYKTLSWEPSDKEFPDHQLNNANGITKWWGLGEPKNDEGKGEELCVDIQFPGKLPPVWYASDCDSKKPYICVHDGEQRRIEDCKNEGNPDHDGSTGGSSPRPDGATQKPIRDHTGTFYPDPKTDGRPGVGDPIIGILKYKNNITTITSAKPPNNCQASAEGIWVPEDVDPLNPFYTIRVTLEEGLRKPDTQECVWTVFTLPHISGEFVPDKDPFMGISGFLTQGGDPYYFHPMDPHKAIAKDTPGTWRPLKTLFPNQLLVVHGLMKATADDSSIFIPDASVPGVFSPSDGSPDIPGSMTQGIVTLFKPQYSPNIEEPADGVWKPNFGQLPTFPFPYVFGELVPWKNDKNFAVFTEAKNVTICFVPDDVNIPSLNGTITQGIPPSFTPSTPIKSENCKRTSGAFTPCSVVKHLTEVHAVMTPENCTENEPPTFAVNVDNVIHGSFTPDNDMNPIPGTLTLDEPRVFTPANPANTPKIDKILPGTWKPKSGDITHGSLKPNEHLPQGSAIFIPDHTAKGSIKLDGPSKKIIHGYMDNKAPFKFTPDDPSLLPTSTHSGIWIPDDPNDPANPFNGKDTHGLVETNFVDTSQGETPDFARFVPDELVFGKIIIIDPLTSLENPIDGTLTGQNPNTFTPTEDTNLIKGTVPATWLPNPPTSHIYPHNIVYGKITPDPNSPGKYIFTPDEFLEGEFVEDTGEHIAGNMTQAPPVKFITQNPQHLDTITHGYWRPNSALPANYPLKVVYGNLVREGGVIFFRPDKTIPATFIPNDKNKASYNGTVTQGRPPFFTPIPPIISDQPKTTLIGVLVISQGNSTTPPKPPNVVGVIKIINGVYTVQPPKWIDAIFYPDGSIVPVKLKVSEGKIPISIFQDIPPPIKVPINGTLIILNLENDTSHYKKPIRGELKYPDSDSFPNGTVLFVPDSNIPGIMVPKNQAIPTMNGHLIVQGPSQPEIFQPSPPVTIVDIVHVIWYPTEVHTFPGQVLNHTNGFLMTVNGSIHFIAYSEYSGRFIPDGLMGLLNSISGVMIDSKPPMFFPNNKDQLITTSTPGAWIPDTNVDNKDSPFAVPKLGVMKPNDDNSSMIWAPMTIPPNEGTYGYFIPDNDNANVITGSLVLPNIFVATIFSKTPKVKTPGTWKPNSGTPPDGPFSEPDHGYLEPKGNDVFWYHDQVDQCDKEVLTNIPNTFFLVC